MAARLSRAEYDRTLASMIAADDAANAAFPQYRGWWAPTDVGPFLAVMLRRFASKGDHIVLEVGEVVLAKPDDPLEVLRGDEWVMVPSCTVAGQRQPGLHAGVFTSELRILNPTTEGQS
jgi:hypothetical protein